MKIEKKLNLVILILIIMVLEIGIDVISNNKIFKNSPNDDEVLSYDGQTKRPNAAGLLTKQTSTLYKSAGTIGEDTSIGTESWDYTSAGTGVAETTMATADTQVAMISTFDVSYYMKLTNFGFSIPHGAVITGIKVKIYKGASANNLVYDTSVKLVKNNVIVGEDKKMSAAWPVYAFPDAMQYFYYGGSYDLWDETWTAEDINEDTFGLVFSGNRDAPAEEGYVDAIMIRIYYIV
jgi:hypothetical protein